MGQCVICKHGETKPGTTTVTLERGELTMVVKGVPARVCSNCREAYVDEETLNGSWRPLRQKPRTARK